MENIFYQALDLFHSYHFYSNRCSKYKFHW